MLKPEPVLGQSIGCAIRDTVILSEVCFVRECLAEILNPLLRFGVCREVATLDQALLALMALPRAGTVLQDVTFPGGPWAASRLCTAFPGTRVIALGVCETPESLFAWAEAGIAGYIPKTASVDDVIALIERINGRESVCPARITAGLLQRDAKAPSQAAEAPPALTVREQEIFRLVGSGLCNKDIARQLGISLGTTKTHVHNLLGKLSLQRRAEVMVRVRRASIGSDPR